MADDALYSSLDVASKATQAIGAAIPGVGGVIVRIAGIALATAAEFAKAGKDPEIEIRRMHSSELAVRGIHKGWDAAIKRKFGRDTDIVPPSHDPYDDEDSYE